MVKKPLVSVNSPLCLSQSCIILTNCYLVFFLLFEPQCCFMTGTHQGFSFESRALQV